MPKKPYKHSVQLAHPNTYICSSFMNRFAIVREEGFALAHFGLVNGAGELLENLVFTFPESSLKALKENLVQYSDKIGLPQKPIPNWKPPAKSRDSGYGFNVVDFVHLVNWEDAYAEICLWSYSQAQAADLAAAGKDAVVHPWGIILIRCSLELQRGFLAALYESDKP